MRTVMSACSRSATRSPTAAASCSGESRCSPGRCGWRGDWDCRSRRTPSTVRRSATCSRLRSPPHGRRNAYGDAAYEVGCLYIGVNDVRALDWDAGRFEERFELALGYLSQRCDRVLTATAPLDLGVPRVGAELLELNAAVERVAGRLGALVVDLRCVPGAEFRDGRPRAPHGARADRDRRAGSGRARARRHAGDGAPVVARVTTRSIGQTGSGGTRRTRTAHRRSG